MKVSFVGIGRLGGALALALSKKGYNIETFITKNSKKVYKIAEKISPAPKIATFERLGDSSSEAFNALSASDAIFITTQDEQISSAAELLSSILQSNSLVFHCSGSLTSEEALQSLKKAGCIVGSIHPLVSVSDPFLGSESFQDAFFCIEAEEKAMKIAEKIVADLGGISFSIPAECKALYHASAVMSAGHLLTLFDLALQMLSSCGLEKQKAQQILLPLAKSVINNLQFQSPSEALTGTFARFDSGTLQKHVRALKEKNLDRILQLYLALGEFSLDLAESRNPELKEQAKRMRNIISEFLC